MVDMTPERIAACYELAKEVYEGRSKADVVEILVKKYGIPEGSVGRYIQAFNCMMEGRKLNQAVKYDYLRYCLKNISDDHEKNQVELSLECLEKHIEYHGNKKKPSNVPGLRKLYNEYSQEIGSSKRL